MQPSHSDGGLGSIRPAITASGAGTESPVTEGRSAAEDGAAVDRAVSGGYLRASRMPPGGRSAAGATPHSPPRRPRGSQGRSAPWADFPQLAVNPGSFPRVNAKMPDRVNAKGFGRFDRVNAKGTYK